MPQLSLKYHVLYYRPKLSYNHIELIGVWRSWLARLVWDQEVGGSNPLTPTKNCISSLSLKHSAILNDMLKIGLTLFAIFLLLLTNELLWHKKILKHEASRKLVHIVVAVFVSIWPYYLSYSTISYISISFLIVVLVSRKLKIFKSIADVNRKTYGDIFFALGILAVSIFSPEKAIFTVAILCVGLSDGLAAIVGLKYGKSN